MSRQEMRENHANVKRGNHPNSRLIMSTQTGIFYECCADAAEAYGMERRLLNDWLLISYRNKTDLIYV